MTAGGVWRLARAGNAVMATAGVAVGALLAEGRVPSATALVPVMLVALLGVVGGNALNDLMDRDVDRRLGRVRPLVVGSVTVGQARWLAGIALAGALALGWAIGPQVALVAAISTLALVAYEGGAKARGLVGNIAVSLPVGGLFLLGAVGVGRDLGGLVLAVAATAFLANVGREIWKDVEDEKADAGFRRTLVMRVGAKAAGIIAASFLGAALLASVAPFAWGLVPGWRWVLVLPTALLFLSTAQDVSGGAAQMKVKLGMAWALFGFGAIVLL